MADEVTIRDLGRAAGHGDREPGTCLECGQRELEPRPPTMDEVQAIAVTEHDLKVAGLDRGYELVACYPGGTEGSTLFGMRVQPGPVGILLLAPRPRE